MGFKNRREARLARSVDGVVQVMAENPNTSPELLRRFWDEHPNLRATILDNPACPSDLLARDTRRNGSKDTEA